MKVGVIYFLKTKEIDSVVKIGFSTSLSNRIRALQTANSSALVLVSALSGSTELEKFFHDIFKPLNKRGEWYLYQGALKSFLEDLVNKKVEKTNNPQLVKIIEEISLYDNISRIQGELFAYLQINKQPSKVSSNSRMLNNFVIKYGMGGLHKIMSLFSDRVSNEKISKEFNVTRQRVHQWQKTFVIPEVRLTSAVLVALNIQDPESWYKNKSKTE